VTWVFVENPPGLWETCSGRGGPETSLGSFPSRCPHVSEYRYGNGHDTREGSGGIVIRDISYTLVSLHRPPG